MPLEQIGLAHELHLRAHVARVARERFLARWAAVVAVAVGLLCGAIVCLRHARTVRVVLTSHTFTVGDRVMLWEDVVHASLLPHRLNWTCADGTVGSLHSLRLTHRQRSILARAIAERMADPRGDRDLAVEARLEALIGTRGTRGCP